MQVQDILGNGRGGQDARSRKISERFQTSAREGRDALCLETRVADSDLQVKTGARCNIRPSADLRE